MPEPNGEFVAVSRSVPDGESDRRCSRIGYALFLLVTFVLGLVLRSGRVANMFKLFPVLDDQCDGNNSSNCLGVMAVYRVSFSLFLFYGIHMLYALCVSRNCGCVPPPAGGSSPDSECPLAFRICLKVFVFLLFLIIPFFIPQDFFKGYAYVALVCAILFLLMQSIILLDFAYGWNDLWAGRASRGEGASYGLLVATTLFIFACTIVLTGLMYHWFVEPDGCGGGDYSRHAFLVTFNLLTGVMHTVGAGFISAKGLSRQASILPSSVVFIYCTWQIFSAIMSWSGDNSCNSIAPTPGKLTVTSILATIIAGLALCYAAVNAGNSRSAFSLSQESANAVDQSEVSDTFFFFCMLTGAGYLAMVLTGWDVEGTADHGSTDLNVDSGKTSMWVKVCTSWFTLLIYIWSLLAPVCCPDRFAADEFAM